ncbi:hypothetical protein GCM10010289_63170 [Streptomyces violascens]|uniref:Uncharacterized protein n=1 Tax=Streptomyces violascens TaxID=67381 RepID=A0ABQ3QSN0_9ACTN|nr:hypothetical protein [Streptomyces violascens]GGU33279.1 hypothetical protein GCM10010289_63170 [Streptomyces violascens]GHI40258.1 hypothetical protein Sviol_46660 [Streptomyces violascens]
MKPTITKASRAVAENPDKDAATKASASEEIRQNHREYAEQQHRQSR